MKKTLLHIAIILLGAAAIYFMPKDTTLLVAAFVVGGVYALLTLTIVLIPSTVLKLTGRTAGAIDEKRIVLYGHVFMAILSGLNGVWYITRLSWALIAVSLIIIALEKFYFRRTIKPRTYYFIMPISAWLFVGYLILRYDNAA